MSMMTVPANQNNSGGIIEVMLPTNEFKKAAALLFSRRTWPAVHALHLDSWFLGNTH